jgi:hypothetical protein
MTNERRSHPRKSSQRPQRPRDALSRVWREAVSPDEAIEILDGGRRELHLNHPLQLVERGRLPRMGLLEA